MDKKASIFATITKEKEDEPKEKKPAWTGKNKLGKIMYTEVSAKVGASAALLHATLPCNCLDHAT